MGRACKVVEFHRGGTAINKANLSSFRTFPYSMLIIILFQVLDQQLTKATRAIEKSKKITEVHKLLAETDSVQRRLISQVHCTLHIA